MESFVCKHFHQNWFRVVFQFCVRHMRNVLMDEQHDPATMDISVFSIYTIWASFREEFWSCNRAVDFGFLNSYNMALMKVKESNNSSFLPLILLIFMLMNFNPLIKLLLFVPQGVDLFFFSFVRGTNLFSVSKFTCSPKKVLEKLKNSHFGQIHVQFLYLTVSAMNEHSTYHNCHTELLCDPLEQHHCKDHSQRNSLENTKLRHQIQFLRLRRHQVLSMKRGSVFHIPHIQGVYPMPYSTFCIGHIETWDLIHFDIPSQDDKNKQVCSLWGFDAT